MLYSLFMKLGDDGNVIAHLLEDCGNIDTCTSFRNANRYQRCNLFRVLRAKARKVSISQISCYSADSTRTSPFGNGQTFAIEDKMFTVSCLSKTRWAVVESLDLNGLDPFMRNIGFRRCDNCYHWIAPQDMASSHYVGNNTRYCEDCWETINNFKGMRIASYHETSNDVSYLTVDDEPTYPIVGYGIEMEADSSDNMKIMSVNGRREVSCTDRFLQENDCYRLFRIEGDGSLDRGCEFISNIMSRKYARQFDWSILTEEMAHIGANDDIHTSGFHVHASRCLLSSDEDDDGISYDVVKNFVKLVWVVNYFFRSDFKLISGRDTENEYAFQYCNFEDNGSLVNSIYALRDFKNGDYWQSRIPYQSHSHALIWSSSGPTIEYRIFKSTSDPERIKHTMALVMGLTEHIKDVDWDKIGTTSEVFKDVPSETMQYWKSKGAFMFNSYDGLDVETIRRCSVGDTNPHSVTSMLLR